MGKKIKFCLIMILLFGSTNTLLIGQTEHKSHKTPHGVPTPMKQKTANEAILNAAEDGETGVILENKMNIYAKKIQVELGEMAKVERIGQGIIITFYDKMLFVYGKSYLNDDNKADLQKFAGTLNECPETEIYIVCHTDNKGTSKYNQALSEKRSQAVLNHLDAIGIGKNRLTACGFGEAKPIMANDSEYNRSLNRRIEIAIYANDKMKADAKMEADL